jgi:hypothetical protein
MQKCKDIRMMILYGLSSKHDRKEYHRG